MANWFSSIHTVNNEQTFPTLANQSSSVACSDCGMCNKMSAQSGYEHTAGRQPSKNTPTNSNSIAGSMGKMPRRRTYSNSSASSAASSASKSAPEDQFLFSPHHTPGPDQPSFFAPVPGTSSNLSRALAKAKEQSSKYRVLTLSMSL